MTQPAPITVLLICGGKYHDIDFARLELLKLLAENQHMRVIVRDNYDDMSAIEHCDMLVTYTCDIVPDESTIALLKSRLQNGLRWFALHGTNSVLQFLESGKVATPPLEEGLRELLGSQFVGHPPIGEFSVHVTQPDHPLVAGLETFSVCDEQYLLDADSDLVCLLHTRFGGSIRGFVQRDFVEQDHPVWYIKPCGTGAVLYLTLGHCRGHYDLRPLMDYYPLVERCAWEAPIFYELLRRGLSWCAHLNDN